MDFSNHSETIEKHVRFQDYFRNGCPFCGSKNYKVVDSWTRKIQDLGEPDRKVIAIVEMKTLLCLNPECNAKYTPENVHYPKSHQYSRAIIKQSLNFAHKFSFSADKIALSLHMNNSVQVNPKTIQSWVNHYSEDYFQAIFAENPEKSLQDLKAITIDGTWFTTGKNVLGKKKNVQFSSVTKLADGTYLLTWWK